MGFGLPLDLVPGLLGGVGIAALLQSFIDDTDGSTMWDLQDPSGAVAVAYNSALALGRDVVINGDFAAGDDGTWTKGTGWTIPGVTVAHCDGSQVANTNLTQSAIVATGKTYEVTFTVSNYGGGTVRARVGGVGGDGTARSSNDTFVETIESVGTFLAIRGDAAFIGDIDNVTVQQTGILASSAYPGAELLTNGDMEAGTTGWLANNAALAEETTIVHSGTKSLKVTRGGAIAAGYQTLTGVLGQTITVDSWGYNPTAGGSAQVNARIGTTPGNNEIADVTSATKDAWVNLQVKAIATADTIYISFGLSGAGVEYVYYDDTSAKSTNPLNGDTTGATVGQAASGPLGLAYLFAPGAYVDILSAELNSMWNPALWSAGIFLKPSSVNVWSDNTERVFWNYEVSGTDYFRGVKNTSNELEVEYMVGGVSSKVTYAATPTDFSHLFATVNASGNLTMYYNGLPVGTDAIANAIVGNLTVVTIGAISTVPASEWDGLLCWHPGSPVEADAATVKSFSQAGGTS